jgi:hypothetical protein
MLRLSWGELHHFAELDAYVRSSRGDVKPAVFYFDLCVLTAEDADISECMLRKYTNDARRN